MDSKKRNLRGIGRIALSIAGLVLIAAMMIASPVQQALAAADNAAAPAQPAAPAARHPGPHIMPKIKSGATPMFAPPGAHLTYYGGPVISNAHVEDVFWGTGTYGTNAGPGGSMPAFFNAVGSSAYFNWLTEYDTNITPFGGGQGTNQVIGHASSLGEVTISPSPANNGSTIDDVNMQAELIAQLNAGQLPLPTVDAEGYVNTIYALFFPDGKTLTQGGTTGGVVWCAYHGTIVYNGKDVPYIVLPAFMPNSGYANGCGGNPTLFNDFTSVTSHELVESVTDMAVGLAVTSGPPLAWYDNTNGEIGDICNAQQGSIAGYVVQTQFSNVAQNCIVTRTVADDFSISASPSSLTIAQGASGTAAISTSVVAGFAEQIGLAVSGAPTGVTASLDKTSVNAGGGATLSVNVGASVIPGTYTLTVTGSASSGSHSATVSLTVPVVNDFSISASPASLTIAQGASDTSTISTAVVSGSAETVSLSVSGAPAGVTASLNPTSVTAGGSSTLTVSVGTSVTPGAYTLTVTGSATSATHSTSISLTVIELNDFSISASPSSLSVGLNASGTSSISTAVVSGSAETVSLSVSGTPVGVTASFNPTSVTAGGSSVLTVNVDPSVAAGTYTFTVTGAAASATHSTTVSLTVLVPAMSLTKTDNLKPGLYSQVGQVVSYTLTATNSGNEALTNVTVSDSPALDNFSCSPALPAASLAPGSSVVCTGSHAITQADLDNGTFTDTASATSDQVSAPNASDTVTAAPRLIVITHVINDNGDTLAASNFTNTVTGSAPSPASFAGAEAPGTAVILGAGSYSVTENVLYGYTQSSSASCSGTIANGQTVTCTITENDQPGTVIIQKITDPANTGNFSFTTTGTGFSAFKLPGGGQVSQSLNAGAYTVTESNQLGWILTGIGQDPANPNNPMACAVSGSGGSSGTGNLSTQTATISLKNGDTVTCMFENTGMGVTRDQGFWATHAMLANIAWFGGTVSGHTLPGVTGTTGIGDNLLCGRPVDTLGKLMGGFWSSISTTSTGAKRSQLDQMRMQLLQQLLAAELNASAFGSVPSGGSGKFALWESAYCGTNQNAIKNAMSQASSFNTAGDSPLLSPGTSADGKGAKAVANIPYWDVLP